MRGIFNWNCFDANIVWAPKYFCENPATEFNGHHEIFTIYISRTGCISTPHVGGHAVWLSTSIWVDTSAIGRLQPRISPTSVKSPGAFVGTLATEDALCLHLHLRQVPRSTYLHFLSLAAVCAVPRRTVSWLRCPMPALSRCPTAGAARGPHTPPLARYVAHIHRGYLLHC